MRKLGLITPTKPCKSVLTCFSWDKIEDLRVTQKISLFLTDLPWHNGSSSYCSDVRGGFQVSQCNYKIAEIIDRQIKKSIGSIYCGDYRVIYIWLYIVLITEALISPPSCREALASRTDVHVIVVEILTEKNAQIL